MHTSVNPNSCIYSISSFYRSADTKKRAEELINKLNSDERNLLLTILNEPWERQSNSKAKISFLLVFSLRIYRPDLTVILMSLYSHTLFKE